MIGSVHHEVGPEGVGKNFYSLDFNNLVPALVLGSQLVCRRQTPPGEIREMY